MPGYLYPTIAEAIEIHKQLIEEFGGSPGLRDRGRLEAAIFRPQIGYYSDPVEEAAALMESLANNHVFVDGNKRVSFAVTDTFLRLNGFYLEAEPSAAYRFITGSLRRGEFRFARIRDWIRSHLRSLSES
ncbi:MAG: type II toxin-antitoxin system death-on-curing family toxin [Terriglobia bacterium]